MKSPLKPDPVLLQSPLKQANSIGSGLFLKGEELDSIFGHNPFKHSNSSVSPSRVKPWIVEASSEKYTAHLKEWNTFASFDPINTSTSSSTAPLLRPKRVQWRQDEFGEIVTEEYEAKFTDQDIIRAQWYDAASFRQFRGACHELTLQASLNPDYTESVRRQHVVCRRGEQPTLEVDDVLEFARFRGLERSVFRNELQTAKFTAIQSIVTMQEELLMEGDDGMEKLGETARQWTAPARQMARTLAIQDRIIAEQAYKDNDDDGNDSISSSSHHGRFIEI